MAPNRGRYSSTFNKGYKMTVPENIRHLSLDEVAECYLTEVVQFESPDFNRVYNDLYANISESREFCETPDGHWDDNESHWDLVWKKLTPLTRKVLKKI